MALRYPDKLKSNNPKEFGIIDASEISGHRFTKLIKDLYFIPDAILSSSKTNKDNDALGQLWYVLEYNTFYQLIDWNNRKNSLGWKKYDAESDGYLYSRLNGEWINPIKTELGDSDIFGISQKCITEELKKKQDNLISGVNISKVNGYDLTSGIDVFFSKSDIGLENVTNDAQVKRSEMGQFGGVATLDGEGKLVMKQLPDKAIEVYLGDYINETTFSSDDIPFPNVPGKLYIDINNGSKVYIWDKDKFSLLFSSTLNVDSLNTKINNISEKFNSDNTTEGSVRYLARDEAENLLIWNNN